MRKEIGVLVLLVLLLTGCGKSAKTSTPPPSPSPQAPSPSGTADKPTLPSGTASPPSRSEPVATPPMPAQARPADMFHQHPGYNPQVNPAVQPQSTFSVDVDTASYTLIRSYLDGGIIPPAEAVRTEELINYFPQSYPVGSAPLSLYVEGGPNPFRPASHLIQIGLQARPVAEYERKPAHLTFVIDISGSMAQENRLGLVKRSLGLLLNQLQPEDQIGLVVYGTRGRILQEQTADKEQIRRAIERLKPEGSTNVEEGLALGYELASRHFAKNAINRVILCSDGVANVGVTGPEAILKRIEDYKQQGITLTTVGFGMGNFNDALMERLADKGDGQYAYVDTLEEADRIFGTELAGTLQVMAKDTKVQVEFDPNQVKSYRLIGYENRAMTNEAFDDESADAGEMGAGHSVTALYEVELKGDAAQIGQVSVRYKDNRGETQELSSPIRRPRLAAPAQVRWNAAIAEFAGILRDSPWSASTTWPNLLVVARQAVDDLEAGAEFNEAIRLMERAQRLKSGE